VRPLRPILAACALAAPAAACASSTDTTTGTYTVRFPSTAAAIATDFVQLLVFDVNDPSERAGRCQELITARVTSPSSLAPTIPPVRQNICDLALSKGQPITVPYGEHALLAVAQRRGEGAQANDFLIGCAIMTIGAGDAPLSIPLRLVSVSSGVPATDCGSVADFCAHECTGR
jgi:hypothetical protein